MLFDTRGRHRRRVVRVIYIGLAVIFLLGFVGLGVGGGFGSGGIFSAFTKEEGGGSSSFSGQVKKYRELTEKQPQNISAWENLTKNLLHEAGGEQYETTSGAVTSKGKELFHEVSQAWDGYIALNPPKPNAELAQQMELIYGEGGLAEDSKEVEVLQIAVAARPTDAALYASLAEYAYKAKNTSVGDLASQKAVSLVPATEKKKLAAELAEVKANPSGEKTYTTTTNGKTYAGKLNAKGEIKATEVKTSSTPSKTSTTKSK
jgi:flagellar basal body-associated protein FliL